MGTTDSPRTVAELAWSHINNGDFDQAEPFVRRLIDLTSSEEAARRSDHFGLLGSVLNCLDRPEEGTEAYKQALAEAVRSNPTGKQVEIARYMLANQHVVYGEAEAALATAEPVPPGSGHVQCLLHSVVARAQWRLNRREEAKASAQRALDTSPTATRTASIITELEDILTDGR